MSAKNAQTNLAGRRAELLAELFLEDLNAQSVLRPASGDLGYDLLVGFPNEKGADNTFAVEVMATERPPGPRFQIPRKNFNRLAHSNIPSLLLVADVKHNRIYYAWLKPENSTGSGNTVSISLIEVTDQTKKELERQLKKANGHMVAAS
jgi:Domain of unknown function (DUF4365)